MRRLTIVNGMYGLACNKWTLYVTVLNNAHLHIIIYLTSLDRTPFLLQTL